MAIKKLLGIDSIFLSMELLSKIKRNTPRKKLMPKYICTCLGHNFWTYFVGSVILPIISLKDIIESLSDFG
jgi:hypothetical protein